MPKVDLGFLYNKRKGVPLLRGRIYFLNLIIIPLTAYKVFNCKLDYWTRLSFYVYYLGNLFNSLACVVYHNSACKTIDRSVYKRIDYAAIFFLNITAAFPSYFYFFKRDALVVLLIAHILVNLYGVFASLVLDVINTTKCFRVILFALTHSYNNVLLYFFYKDKLYLAMVAFVVAYLGDLIGAVVYSVEKPNLVPGLFEFHELAHSIYTICGLFILCFNLISTDIFKDELFYFK